MQRVFFIVVGVRDLLVVSSSDSEISTSEGIATTGSSLLLKTKNTFLASGNAFWLGGGFDVINVEF